MKIRITSDIDFSEKEIWYDLSFCKLFLMTEGYYIANSIKIKATPTIFFLYLLQNYSYSSFPYRITLDEST